MDITTTAVEETKTVHFDTRLTFEVDGDDNVIGGSKTMTEQELYEALKPVEEVEEVEEDEVTPVVATY